MESMVLACADRPGRTNHTLFLVNVLLFMNYLDWGVLLLTIVFIVAYGVIRTRGKNTMDNYLKGDNMKWWMIGISIMATQASAVTFLSVPGQAFVDGMRFLQF